MSFLFCVEEISEKFYAYVGILGVGYTSDRKYPLKGILASQGIKGLCESIALLFYLCGAQGMTGIIAKQCKGVDTATL